MWRIVSDLKKSGVTIILTTHYIEEAEAIADRVGVINHGELILVEEKTQLIKKMGQKKLMIDLQSPINSIPAALKQYNLKLSKDGHRLSYTYNVRSETTGITSLLQSLREQEIKLKDLKTEQSSLENIFVNLVKKKKQ
jgi:ABC-2 type transport system ATP-binding protein